MHPLARLGRVAGHGFAWLVAVAYLAEPITQAPNHVDEGFLLESVRLVAAGERVFWDFIDIYGPLNYTGPALFYELFGAAAVGVRVWVLIVKLLCVVLAFFATRRFADGLSAWLTLAWTTVLLGLPWQAITHLALTHFDNDHIADVGTLLVAWRHGQLPPRSAPVTVLGPVGTRALLERMAGVAWDKLLAPGYPVEVCELASGDEVTLADGVTLAAVKVPHTAESLAYAVRANDRRLVYTGDTAYDEGLAEWAAGCDLLLAECSLPARMALPSHLTPEQVGRLARKAGARRLVLTHLYPPVERMDVRAAVAAEYDGPVALAADGWALDLQE